MHRFLYPYTPSDASVSVRTKDLYLELTYLDLYVIPLYTVPVSVEVAHCAFRIRSAPIFSAEVSGVTLVTESER